MQLLIQTKLRFFATTRLARQKLQNFEFPQSLDDKLLGASLSFTKDVRVNWLTNELLVTWQLPKESVFAH